MCRLRPDKVRSMDEDRRQTILQLGVGLIALAALILSSATALADKSQSGWWHGPIFIVAAILGGVGAGILIAVVGSMAKPRRWHYRARIEREKGRQVLSLARKDGSPIRDARCVIRRKRHVVREQISHAPVPSRWVFRYPDAFEDQGGRPPLDSGWYRVVWEVRGTGKSVVAPPPWKTVGVSHLWIGADIREAAERLVRRGTYEASHSHEAEKVILSLRRHAESIGSIKAEVRPLPGGPIFSGYSDDSTLVYPDDFRRVTKETRHPRGQGLVDIETEREDARLVSGRYEVRWLTAGLLTTSGQPVEREIATDRFTHPKDGTCC